MRTWLVVIAAAVVGLAAGAGTAVFRVNVTAANTQAMLAGEGSVSFPAPGAPRAKVVVDQADFDFGTMDNDATNSHEFVFNNAGDDTLILTKGDTTCRCTLINLVETDIPPGKSAKVALQWTSKNMAGPYRQSATIVTNDPDRPRVTLTITGRVTSPIRVAPTELILNNLSVVVSETVEARVFCYSSGNLQITAHELAEADLAKFFEVTSQPLSADELKGEADVKSGVLVKLAVKPGLPLGAFRQKIRLSTNLKESPTIEIPVEGTVTSDIAIVGQGWNEKTNVLTLGSVSNRKATERKLLLVCRGEFGKEVTYRIAQTEPDVLKVELGQRNQVKQGRASTTPLMIRIPEGSRPVNHLGTESGELGRILIKTNHPQVHELQIRVRFAVEE
jgi:hypothetical protein